ncbi:LysE family translocator [Neoroseomonas oryzicola]|uniref:LysE family translocator n=1 Tax=Neoroseomonas oryzicola TaxID=535904 RepID=A0A9X9WKW1_9PROT|nr:LysE family translocator [Neoroseomonas oryzicola]MBR0660971.1 LysE family translocator [Neoroseomonas oryzicola]NKE19851.1 LysE family translocator [Neoroseomonas oryzicola]
MTTETWLAFVAATAVMLAIPGPTILLVIGQSLGAGRRAALPLVAGVALGDLTAMTLSLAGLGALLAASATLFTVLKLGGAAYLVWLGVKLWRAPVAEEAQPPVSARRAFRDAYVVTALNPKSIAFFVAFVPLFVDAGSPFLPQAVVLVATFVTLAAVNAGIYALLAARLSGAVARPAVRRAFNRTGGTLLVGAGVATAAMQRA